LELPSSEDMIVAVEERFSFALGPDQHELYSLGDHWQDLAGLAAPGDASRQRPRLVSVY
jgi:hypothetical protein